MLDRDQVSLILVCLWSVVAAACVALTFFRDTPRPQGIKIHMTVTVRHASEVVR